MPSRTQTMIRRDINRMDALADQKGKSCAPLQAVADLIKKAAQKVNETWQAVQKSAVSGDKERSERDKAADNLDNWMEVWRPVVLMRIPGADKNIHTFPANAATPDDIIRAAEDIAKLINENPAASGFKGVAINALKPLLAAAKKETAEASAALPREASAQRTFSEACAEANTVLIPALQIVRNQFGPTSPEYKQFIRRASAEEEDQIDQESETAEGVPETVTA